MLLLRSGKHTTSGKYPRHSTRIDILFKSVRALECCFEMDGLEIAEVGPEFLDDVRRKADVRSGAKEVIEVGIKVFSLKSGSWVGFVVAGCVFQEEDEEESFFAPGKFDLESPWITHPPASR